MYANNLSYEGRKTEDSTAAKKLANEAVKYYRHTIRLYPSYPEMFYKLASTYRYNLNDMNSAETCLKQALSLDSAYFNASFELAKLYLDRQDLKSSYAYFQRTHAIAPSDSLTLFYYAQVASALNDTVAAYKINSEFISLYPHMQYPYLNMGKYYSQMRKDDTAVLYFDKAIQLGSRNPELLEQMAVYFDAKRQPQKAAYYRSLLKRP
jgi:tetratricopeptide (TPR) repeat protein